MRGSVGRRVAFWLGVGSWVCFAAALAVAAWAFSTMDPQRLCWEGGEQYIHAAFPFVRVWAFCLLGLALAAAGFCVSRSPWVLLSCAILANALLYCWYVHRYEW